MLTVKSIGTASLTITDISDPGEPFGLTNLPDMPAVLSPDSSITFDVTFSPADTGTFNSTFSVISNDDENPEFKITVNAKGFTIHPAQPGVCYATLAYSNPVGGYSGLISIDPESGAGTLIGETGLRHIAINSKGEIYGLGPGNRENYPAIYRVDALSGGSRFVMDPDIRATWSMAFDQNDLLYIMGGSSKHFYSIDLTSGTVNDIGAIRPGIAGDILWDMAFDPITGTLWAIDGFYYIYKIDPSTAEMTWVGDTKVYSLDGLGFDVAGNLYAVTTGSSTSGIYSIDKSTGIASPIGDIGFWPVIDFSFFNVPVEGKHLSVTSRNIDFGSIDVNGIRSMPVTIGNYGTEDMIGTIGTDWGIECLAFNQVKDVSDILDMKNVIPMVYALKQNYPNPFNASTTIAYDLPVAGKVELAVYDILGKKVATLVNDHQTAGKHAVEWDAIGQSSGLYFYQIKAGDFLKIKKCILLK